MDDHSEAQEAANEGRRGPARRMRVAVLAAVLAVAAVVTVLALTSARPAGKGGPGEPGAGEPGAAGDGAGPVPTRTPTRPTLGEAWADGELRLGIVGDSLTDGWMADSERGTYRERVRAANGYPGDLVLDWVAVPGATSGDMLRLAGGVVADAEVVLVATGTNDTALQPDLAVLDAEYPELLASVPIEKTLLCLGPWLTASEAIDRMREHCERADGRFIDLTGLYELRGPAGEPGYPLTKDAYHPNDAGHAGIAERVIAALVP